LRGCSANVPGERPAEPVRSGRKLDSAARPPMPWIPAAMHDRQDNDLFVDKAEVHGIRKSTDTRPPRVALHVAIGQRILKNRRDRCFDRRGEDSAQADTLSLVLSSRIK
jgi:hypothetical protein